MANGSRDGVSPSGAAHEAPAGAAGKPVGVLPWQVFLAELVGTALLVLVGVGVSPSGRALFDRRRTVPR